MLIGIIPSFLPWFLYFILSGPQPAQMELAIIAATVASIIFQLKDLKKGFILSWGTLLFLLFMLSSVVFFKSQWVLKHAWIFSNGSLALIALVSLLLRRPFTLQYAREKVTKDKWQHPLFIKINYILTLTWGFVFLLNTLLQVLRLYHPVFSEWIYQAFTYGLIFFGVGFTIWFPNWYREKYMRGLTHAK